MKKILPLIVIVLLLSGCGKDKVTCKYSDKGLPYKNSRTLVITFENNSIFSFKSTIKEEHSNDESANNSYIKYQDLYNNYNENNVNSEYIKAGKKITAIYNIDLRDIETKKIEFEFDFTQNKSTFLNTLKGMGYSCK